MQQHLKQFIFIALLAIVFTGGVLTIRAVSNRGSAPVAWWRLDEGYGSTANDASSNTNSGTITNATWKNESDCKFGKCLYFDGSGDYVTVTDHASIEPTTGITIEAWVRPNVATGTLQLVTKDSQYSLDIINYQPRFRAYANNQWWIVQTSPGTITFQEHFDNSLTGDPVATFTAAFGYRALGPSNLTSENGILITQSDNLQYSRGSQSTPDGTNVVYENFNPNQGTLEFWVRPNFDGDDGESHYIFDEQGTSAVQNRILFHISFGTATFAIRDGAVCVVATGADNCML